MAKINIVALIIFLVSCGQQQEPAQQPASGPAEDPVTDTVAVADAIPNTSIDHFQEIGKTGILMFPLSTGKPERSGINLTIYKGSPAGAYWNVVFHNSRTGENRLLGENKMLITSIIPYSETAGVDMPDSVERYIFYSVKTSDVNKDGKLDDKDPDHLFISALDGTGFRQVSPAGYHVRSWGSVWSANKIMMVVSRDSDKNGEFNSEDDEWVYAIDPSRDKEPKEVFSSELKSRMKMLHDRDWKKKEK